MGHLSPLKRKIGTRLMLLIVAGDNLYRLFMIIGDPNKVHILRRDQLLLCKMRFNPFKQSAPVLFTDQDDRDPVDAFGLDQCKTLKNLIQRPKASRKDDK